MIREIIGDSARGEEYAAARLLVDGTRIVAADTPGMSRDLAGLTLLEAAAVPGERLAADALANALAQVFRAEPAAARVAVAMSGGVDSAVALLRALPDAVGITLRLWLDPHGPAADRVCCSPDAVIAARETCHALGVPHLTLDLREEFRTQVVKPFVEGYAAGLTPNPCSRCNGSFRFDALLEAAGRAGAAALWTGHYARVVERSGVRLIARAHDSRKDQSYMLATVDPGLLTRVAFPLGTQDKDATRAEAESAGLAAAHRAESQEACFLAGGDYRSFLERQGIASQPGAIVDEAGNELGRHDGVWRFTPGQRRGLRVSGSEPLYAIRLDKSTNAVVAGPRSALRCSTIEVDGTLHLPVDRAAAKLRYRSEPVPARVVPTPPGFTLELDGPASAGAPGQIAALDRADAIVGSGVITAAGR